MTWAVSTINYPWPVTTHDVSHAASRPRYIQGGAPSVAVNPLEREGRTISATWTYTPDCVEGITVEEHLLCWDVATPSVYSRCKDEDGPTTSA